MVAANRPSSIETGTPSQREYRTGSVNAAKVTTGLAPTTVAATTTGVVRTSGARPGSRGSASAFTHLPVALRAPCSPSRTSGRAR